LKEKGAKRILSFKYLTAAEKVLAFGKIFRDNGAVPEI
jgi:hypothetical protein